MKHIKTFEEAYYYNIIYYTDNIKIEKLENYMIFHIKNKVYSLTTGIFLLLNSEYETDQKLRDIQIIKPKGPALNNNTTRKSVAKLIQKKYNINIIGNKNLYKLLRFNQMFEQSSTIGDLFDNARKIINNILFESEIKKYNL